MKLFPTLKQKAALLINAAFLLIKLKHRHSGVGRNPVFLDVWTPAYAGVTECKERFKTVPYDKVS